MSTLYPKGTLNYKSIDVYFIYSFVFDYNVPYEKIVEALCTKPSSGNDECIWKQDLPPDRVGIHPYLVIKKKIGGENKTLGEYISKTIFKKLKLEGTYYLCPDSYLNENSGADDNFKIDIEAYIRVFDSGTGCITIKVSSKDEVSLRKIHHILSLSRRIDMNGISKGGSYSRLKVALDGNKKEADRLFDIFKRELILVKDEINKLVSDKNKDQKNEALSILCKEVVEISSDDDKQKTSQNPYVFTTVEIEPESNGKMFWEKNLAGCETIVQYYKEVLLILLRLEVDNDFFQKINDKIENIRIPYDQLDKYGCLKNYAWDNRLLTCFSKRSCMVVCQDKTMPPAKYIKSSLLDMMEIIRTRWHMSILINALLDQDMDKIKDVASSENLNALSEIIKRRKQFALFLHDPLPYSFEGGSITEICEVAEKEMQLSKLSKMTFQKFEVLDKLFEDQMRFVRITEFREIEEDFDSMNETFSKNIEIIDKDSKSKNSI